VPSLWWAAFIPGLFQALNETQPILSLQTAEDVDLEMDVDFLAQADTLGDGDETDNSDDGL
jgi:hypothetical protein